MTIYAHPDYRSFLRERISAAPSKGRGEMLRMATHAGIHSSVLSQVFNEKRDLTSEQAAAIAEYLGLVEPDAAYFLLLTQLARAGTERLRTMIKAQLEALRLEQMQPKKRVTHSRPLTSEEKAVFYSNWHYTAARLLMAIPAYRKPEALRKKLGLSRSAFRLVIDFLLDHRLCTEKGGELHHAEQSTHLEGESPLVSRHHANWRLKAMEKHPGMDLNKELSFTCPMALSKSDAAKIRALLLDVIEKTCAIADPSPSENIFYLNIDWLEL